MTLIGHYAKPGTQGIEMSLMTASILDKWASTTSTQDTARLVIASLIATADAASRSCPGPPPTVGRVTGQSSGMTAMTSISRRLLGGTRPAIMPVLATGLVK